MSTPTSLLIGIALLSSAAFVCGAGAANNGKAKQVPTAASVGQCNALAGRALGLVHRIDQGNIDLCQNLQNLFIQFAGGGCIERLVDEELFLNHAIGEYQLACQVATTCPDFPPLDPRICVFDE